MPGRGAAGSGFNSVISESARPGLERVHGPRAGVGHHHQIARLVERQVDRVERIVAHRRKLARGRGPAVDALPVRVHEVEVSGWIDRAARDVVEAARQFLHLRAGLQHDARRLRRDWRARRPKASARRTRAAAPAHRASDRRSCYRTRPCCCCSSGCCESGCRVELETFTA